MIAWLRDVPDGTQVVVQFYDHGANDGSLPWTSYRGEVEWIDETGIVLVNVALVEANAPEFKLGGTIGIPWTAIRTVSTR